MHSSGSMTRKFGPSWKQSTGQTSTQSVYLHLMQASVTTKVMPRFLEGGERRARDCATKRAGWPSPRRLRSARPRRARRCRRDPRAARFDRTGGSPAGGRARSRAYRPPGARAAGAYRAIRAPRRRGRSRTSRPRRTRRRCPRRRCRPPPPSAWSRPAPRPRGARRPAARRLRAAPGLHRPFGHMLMHLNSLAVHGAGYNTRSLAPWKCETPASRRRFGQPFPRRPARGQPDGTNPSARMTDLESQSIVVRFAGDSGDGVQLMGTQFVAATALAGSDFATFPDYPAEIRAPAGTTYGVSAYQIHLGARPITTAGDAPQVLVAFN